MNFCPYCVREKEQQGIWVDHIISSSLFLVCERGGEKRGWTTSVFLCTVLYVLCEVHHFYKRTRANYLYDSKPVRGFSESYRGTEYNIRSYVRFWLIVDHLLLACCQLVALIFHENDSFARSQLPEVDNIGITNSCPRHPHVCFT